MSTSTSWSPAGLLQRYSASARVVPPVTATGASTPGSSARTSEDLPLLISP